jgi:hypothetical protein
MGRNLSTSQKNKKKTAKKRSVSKTNRELVLNIYMFLLNSETMRKCFWNIKSVDYNKVNQTLDIGINTTKGKLGTTLGKLRKNSKSLSDYLFTQGITFRKAKINFFVDKEDIEMERIYNLLDSVDEKKNIKSNNSSNSSKK